MQTKMDTPSSRSFQTNEYFHDLSHRTAGGHNGTTSGGQNRYSRTPIIKSLSGLGVKSSNNVPRETSGTLVLQINDTGIGIPKQFINRLF